MNTIGYIALYAWVPLTLVFFLTLRGRTAALVSVLAGWLFLPNAKLDIQGLPDISKFSVISVGALLSIAIADSRALFSYRFRWLDVPMLLWCFWPLPSGISAGLSIHAGLSAVLNQVLLWGIPYLIGRIYFATAAARYELLRALFLAGMIYMPLCWFEVRMSPRLHLELYGFNQHVFLQTIRFGGYRPQVFLAHGLVVSMLMAASTVAALGLAYRDRLSRVAWFRVSTWALVLMITTVLCKSVGAVLLLVVGAAALTWTRRGRHRWVLGALLAITPVYIGAQVAGAIPGEAITGIVGETLGSRHASSIEMRLEAERSLVAKGRQRPLMGSGPEGHFRISEDGRELARATDSAWIIFFGKYGLVGLLAFYGGLLFIVGSRTRRLGFATRPSDAVVTLTLAVVLTLYLLDSLLNANSSLLIMLIAGALACQEGPG